ncbi:MAG: hypothetical protein Q7O66_00835 [Dehalococcoidia bacterium]|nr:hypothetical protein [Dehalococcoidia bacterium]
MKRIEQTDCTILDLGEVLVIVPASVDEPRVEAWGRYTGGTYPVSGFERFTTRAGREAIRVQPGTGFTLRIYDGGGDRTWGDWADRQPWRSEHGDVFSIAVATSNGGGCWFEVGIWPTAGYLSAYEARIADELAV